MGSKRSNLSGFWGKFKLVISPLKVKFGEYLAATYALSNLINSMSMQRRMSPPDFGTTTTGLTHGVGPCAGSIMSSSMSSLIFSSNFDLMLNGVLRIGCATGVTLGSMWSCTARSFNFPTPLKTFGNFCCRIPPMVFGSALTAAMPIPIFSTPRLFQCPSREGGLLHH